VHDALLVRRGQGRGHLLGHVNDRRQGQGPVLADAQLEVDAFEVLHHEVGLAPRGRAEVHDRDQVRVAQARGDLGLAPEARQGLRVRRQALRHHLHRHPLPQAKLDRLVDRAHAPLGDEPVDPVCPFQRRPDEGGVLRLGSPRRGPLRHPNRLRRAGAHGDPQKLPRHCMRPPPTGKKPACRAAPRASVRGGGRQARSRKVLQVHLAHAGRDARHGGR